MAHHERHQITGETGAMNEREHGGDVGAVVREVEQRAETEERAERKRVDRDLNVVGHDRARANLVLAMIALAPTWFWPLSVSHQRVLVSMFISRNVGSTPTSSENSGSLRVPINPKKPKRANTENESSV